MKKSEIGLVILAAGASVRLGAPKQLLRFEGETFLRRIALASAASVCRPVIAVFGAQSDRFKTELSDLDVHAVENFDWQKGMGSSVKTGVERLLEINESAEAVVLAVCDQPFVTTEIIDRLARTYRKNKVSIVASAYGETLGVPALFSRALFPQLLQLEGFGGAKQIIKQFAGETISVAFPAGATDIDTPEDFAQLIAPIRKAT